MSDCYMHKYITALLDYINLFPFQIPDLQPNRLIASWNTILIYITSIIAEDKQPLHWLLLLNTAIVLILRFIDTVIPSYHPALIKCVAIY